MAEVTKFMDKNLLPPDAKIDSVVEGAPSVSVNAENKTEVPKATMPDLKKGGKIMSFIKAKLNKGGTNRVG